MTSWPLKSITYMRLPRSAAARLTISRTERSKSARGRNCSAVVTRKTARVPRPGSGRRWSICTTVRSPYAVSAVLIVTAPSMPGSRRTRSCERRRSSRGSEVMPPILCVASEVQASVAATAACAPSTEGQWRSALYAPEWTRTTTEKISPLGPQPSASTNSATSAEGASIASGAGEPPSAARQRSQSELILSVDSRPAQTMLDEPVALEPTSIGAVVRRAGPRLARRSGP